MRLSTAGRTFALLAFFFPLSGEGGNASSTGSEVASVQATPAAESTDSQRILAGPHDYLAKLRKLRPGQTLILTPGTYDDPSDVPGLPITGLNGNNLAPIVVAGEGDPGQTILRGRATHNTVRFRNSSYVTVRNLTIDGQNLGGDGVKAEGISHDITLENLVIRGVGGDQQTVGISTSGATTWNWTIRGNTIVGAGTGMYLGNSDGTNPFIAGLIERNVVRDSIGYNVQIKHQAPWPKLNGLPTGRTSTIIRHNVFTKGSNSSIGGMARPNLLIGDVPTSGPGTENGYEVYGNFFYRNPTEALFQAEGNIAFYSNVLVNDAGPAINIQRHNGLVRNVLLFGNTILAASRGVSVTGGHAAYLQQVTGNAVFAATPISASNTRENLTDSYENAGKYLTDPFSPPGRLDVYPKPLALRGTAIDSIGFRGLTDAALDFNGRPRDWTLRGAYSGEGQNPAWALKIERKP